MIILANYLVYRHGQKNPLKSKRQEAYHSVIIAILKGYIIGEYS